MWMNGSMSAGSVPANARRTGNPSPSSPRGAVVTLITGRNDEAAGSGWGMCGSVVTSVTVIAGMPVFPSESERPHGRHHMFEIPAHSRDVNVQLDLVAVGIQDVQAVADGVIAGADHAHARRLATADRRAQLIVRIADLEPEVVQAHVASTRQWQRVLAHLDQQQLVVSPAAAEEGDRDASERAVASRLQTLPPEHVAVKRRRPLDIANVQNDMTEFLDLH